MVQQIIKFFSTKEKVKEVKGFADLQLYIFKKIAGLKKEITQDGINLLSFSFFRILFLIKTFLGIFGQNQQNMWKFFDGLILIEVVNENSVDIQSIYYRVKNEANEILDQKIKRGNLSLKFTEVLFFLVLISFCIYISSLFFKIESSKNFVAIFLLVTIVLYFIPFFLFAYRRRIYKTVKYYLNKENEGIQALNQKELFNQPTIYLIGILNRTRDFYFGERFELSLFLFERKMKNLDNNKSTIFQLLGNFNNNDANRSAVIKKLILIKSSCNYYHQNYTETNEKYYLETVAHVEIMLQEFRKSDLNSKFPDNTFGNLLALFLMENTFEIKTSINLSLYFTKDELLGLVTTITGILNDFKNSFTKKSTLKLYPILD